MLSSGLHIDIFMYTSMCTHIHVSTHTCFWLCSNTHVHKIRELTQSLGLGGGKYLKGQSLTIGNLLHIMGSCGNYIAMQLYRKVANYKNSG